LPLRRAWTESLGWRREGGTEEIEGELSLGQEQVPFGERELGIKGGEARGEVFFQV
jgi:hypothetical protein